jgi:hypothetical protein
MARAAGTRPPRPPRTALRRSRPGWRTCRRPCRRQCAESGDIKVAPRSSRSSSSRSRSRSSSSRSSTRLPAAAGGYCEQQREHQHKRWIDRSQGYTQVELDAPATEETRSAEQARCVPPICPCPPAYASCALWPWRGRRAHWPRSGFSLPAAGREFVRCCSSYYDTVVNRAPRAARAQARSTCRSIRIYMDLIAQAVRNCN